MDDSADPTQPATAAALEGIRTASRALPGYPWPLTGSVADVYVTALSACATPDQLRAFTAAWSPLWTIDFETPGATPLEGERRLTAGDYDASEVLEVAAVLRAEGDDPDLGRKMATVPAYQAAVHLLMPRALIQVQMMANYFGVPENVAWYQAAALPENY